MASECFGFSFSSAAGPSSMTMSMTRGATLEEGLDELCSHLASVERTSFSISGFTATPWPVRVHTDLPILLEQIGNLLESLHRRQELVLDLYEQGIEKELHMGCEGEGIRIECLSHIDWEPQYPKCLMPRQALAAMAVQVFEQATQAFDRICPDWRMNAELGSWERSIRCQRLELTGIDNSENDWT